LPAIPFVERGRFRLVEKGDTAPNVLVLDVVASLEVDVVDEEEDENCGRVCISDGGRKREEKEKAHDNPSYNAGTASR
jgi:hypothetical protein